MERQAHPAGVRVPLIAVHVERADSVRRAGPRNNVRKTCRRWPEVPPQTAKVRLRMARNGNAWAVHRLTPGNPGDGGAEGIPADLLTEGEQRVEQDADVPPGGTVSRNSLVRLRHDHPVAAQPGAGVAASLDEQPGFSSCGGVEWLVSAPALQIPSGLRDEFDGGMVVPACGSGGVPSKNYCSHYSPNPAHTCVGLNSLQNGT
jgi:hypothetical protein